MKMFGKRAFEDVIPPTEPDVAPPPPVVSSMLERDLRERVLKEIDPAIAADVPSLVLRQLIEKIVHDIATEHRMELSAREQLRISEELANDMTGYGPLEALLADDGITDIMVNAPTKVYVERHGKLERSTVRFRDANHIASIARKIASAVGRRIDRSRPLVDARLTDGSRVNAVIPPLAVSGPCLTIRKFPARKLLIDDLVEKGSLTETVAEFLLAAVYTRRNILISGGTGSGKTTLLNCLSDFIPDKERIVTIEDTAELQLKKEHVVRLETRESNVEGAGAYTIRDLVRNALRMRPDRIVVGECRGTEASTCFRR